MPLVCRLYTALVRPRTFGAALVGVWHRVLLVPLCGRFGTAYFWCRFGGGPLVCRLYEARLGEARFGEDRLGASCVGAVHHHSTLLTK